MADLFPTRSKVMLQQLHVVPHLFGASQKFVVRHEQRRGEIARQRNAAESNRFGGGQVFLAAIDDALHVIVSVE